MFLLLGATTMANEEAIASSTLGPSAEESFENTVLIPCTICGRTFKSESLQKHQAVCQKNATKKRRVFDSMKQRIQGTELAEYIPIPVVPPKPKLIPINKFTAKKLSKDDHRTGESQNVGQHTNTPASTEKTLVRVSVARSNSTGIHGVPRGGGASSREERCPHCDRTFGWKAFSRHEEWCREHKSRLVQAQSPAAVLKAKEMLEARIKYRAPTLGKSKRPTNREKYAGGGHGSPAVHPVHKVSVDESPVLSSMKATVSSSNKVVSESRVKVTLKSSMVQTSSAHQPITPSNTGPGNTPRRGLSPSKKISRVIHSPWKQNINVDQNSGGDENLSSPPSTRNRNKHSSESGGDSNHEEDYNKVFDSIPVLEYSEDNDKDEELLQWIKSVKVMLKKRNKVHSRKENKKGVVESPVSPMEVEKVCQWETKSTASNERMKRTFVYKALDSSDESVDSIVGANSEEVSPQNEEVNVLFLNETQTWMKGDDSRRPLPTGNTQTLDRAKVEAGSQTSVGNCDKGFSHHSQPQVKKSKFAKSQRKIISSSVSCDVSLSANLCPGSGSVDTNKQVSPDNYIGGMIDEGHKKGITVKKRSKLPVPVSKFCDQQTNKMDETIKDTGEEMMIDGQPIDLMINLSKCSPKNLNNTFILSKKSHEECGLDVQRYSNKLSPKGIEIDSLESSSSGTSPQLQKGIIHECVPEMFEAKIPADECRMLKRNKSRRMHSSGKHKVEEICSIPVHLLVKNNDSSHENSNVTGCSDDFNNEVHEGQVNIFGAGFSQSPSEVEANKKGSQVEFNVSGAYYCEQNEKNDSSYYHYGDLASKTETLGSSCCYFSLFDNHHDSPLAVDDLSTDPLTLSRDYPKSKMSDVLSYKNDIKLGVTSSCPSIKVHYHQNDEGEEAHCLGRRLGSLKKGDSSVMSHASDVHSEDCYESPKSSHVPVSQIVFNKELVQSDDGALKGSHKENDTQSSILNIVIAHQENISNKKGLSGNCPERHLITGQNAMHGNCHQGGSGRKATSKVLEVSLDSEFPEDLRGGRLNIVSLVNENEVKTCHSEEVEMNIQPSVDKIGEEVDGNALDSQKYLNLAKDEMRKGGILSRKDSSSVSVLDHSSKGNISVGGITSADSSISCNVHSCGNGHSKEHALGTSMSSLSLCSNPANLCSSQSSTSNLNVSKVGSLISVLRKYTKSPHDPSDTSPKSKGHTQECSMMATDENLVTSTIRHKRGKTKNRRCKGEKGSKVHSGVQERNEGEGTKILNKQPSPAGVTLLAQSGNGNHEFEGYMDADETSTFHLPTIGLGNDLEGLVSPQSSVENMASAQLKWLNLIRRLSETEVDSVESLEGVIKMPDNNESLFPQRKGVVQKAGRVGLSSSDRKAAEDRVKSRLLGANRQGRLSSQGLRSPPGARSPACSRQMVTLPPVRTRPKMDVNGKSLPPSPFLPQPNQNPPLSSPLKSYEEEKIVGGCELAPLAVSQPPSRHSTYDPFSRAEMQLKELLSDGGEVQKEAVDPSLEAMLPTKHPSGQPTETFQNGVNEKHENISTKTNGSISIHEIYANQKQAKEIELPDLFTETSTQLNFEMPNVMRSRDRCVNTKRRALKPTAQNMGIELNTIGRDSSVGRPSTAVDHSKNVGNKFEDEEVEQITSIMNMGFCIPRMSSRGNAKGSPRDELDIDSIHQSINLVALGLTNLSANSQESLADKDNNNEYGGMKGRVLELGGRMRGGEEQRMVGERKEEGRGGSSGDSDSEGGAQRVARRVRVRPRAVVGGGGGSRGHMSMEGDGQEQDSSHESLTATQPLISGKLSVDSAYSSLNRPAFRTIEQVKEATGKALGLPQHSTSSEGENDHAEEWSDNEGAKKASQNKWSSETETSATVKYAKFCHNCGSKYPLTEAKFCCVCGSQRLAV